jgi:hypothetical protein
MRRADVKTASLLVLAAPVLLLAAVACQSIADLQSRTADPLPVKGSCGLPGPTNGNGKIRLVNLASASVPASQNFTDFCIKPSSSSDWGRPVFRDGGDSYSPGTPGAPGGPDALCSKGLPYMQSTIPFNVPTGKIDVKAIPAGSTCDAAATSQITGYSVGDVVNRGAPVVTIVRWGGDQISEALTALPEELPSAIQNTSQSYFRVINALSSKGMPSIQFGTPIAKSLPTTVGTPFIYKVPIKPGGIEPQGMTRESTTIDAQGYNQTIPLAFYFAVSLENDPANTAIALFNTPATASGDVATLYVIGEQSSTSYPLRGLYCEDNPKFTLGTGGTDAGADGGNPALTGYSTQDLKLLANCTPTALPLLSVDTFNAALYGANSPYEGDRKSTIETEIAGRSSDVMCLLEVSEGSDRDAIAKAAIGQFPYTYSIQTTVTTSPTNAADVKPTPTMPPCGGVDLTPITSCVEQKCSTGGPDAGTGVLNGGTNCLSQNCTFPFIPIHSNNLNCFDCIIYYLTSLQQISAMQTACTQDDNPPFAFVGQTPSMILSHYPLVNTKAYILPATGFRRAVLKAQVQLEDQTVDFFCGQLSSPLIDRDLPYTGNYGSDKGPNMNGWQDEQDLQAQEAIKWMVDEADADGYPAIFAGDWHSSLPCTAANPCTSMTTLTALSPEVNTSLTSYKGKKGTAVLAHPTGYQRTCDYCASSSTFAPNSYNTGPYSYEWSPMYVYGFPKGSAVSESLWDTTNIVPIPETNSMAPIAEAYPRNVQLIRPH